MNRNYYDTDLAGNKIKSQTQANSSNKNYYDDILASDDPNLALKKHLYETGLQNVFNDYQKSIASLDTQKQQEIEDAYFVREMGKKYLGEYASNIGLSDVSGELLDLYGSYQSNINEINKNYEALEYNMAQEFNTQKQQYEQGLLEVDLEEKVGQTNKTIDEALNKVYETSTKEEYDKYVDELDVSDNQKEQLKEKYSILKSTTFTPYVGTIDYIPSSMNVNREGSKYVSADNNNYLVETQEEPINEISNPTTFKELNESSTDINYDTPFEYSGNWFVKQNVNGDNVFKKLDIIPSNKNIDFEVKSVEKRKGTIVIDGEEYNITKNDKPLVDVENNWNKDNNDFDIDDITSEQKIIVQEFIDRYFNGNKEDFTNYIESPKNSKKKDGVYVVKSNDKYYTIIGSLLYELPKK